MNPAQREAMIDIAEMGYNLPPEKVDMGYWWCGTVGCVMGHAIKKLPSVRALGLTLTEFDHNKWCVECPVSGLGGPSAVANALIISKEKAVDIFCNSSDSIEVSNKILDYLGVAHI